ncbi:MAG: LSM domain-containing protein [Thermoprotei archaeon]
MLRQGQRIDPRQQDRVSRPEPPTRFIKNALNTEVLVRLKDGSEFLGKLVDYDMVMNLILVEAREIDEASNPLVNLGKVMIRGSNIIFVRVST